MKHSKRITKNAQQSGFSVVELLVAMLMGLMVSLAVYGVLSANESRKKTTNSINDINQIGIYTLSQLDQSIRSAGAGLLTGAQSSMSKADAINYILGCPITAARGGAQQLPSITKLPAPFNNLPLPLSATPLTFRIAPVIILDGAAPAGDDIIITMSGNAGLGEIASKLSEVPQIGSMSFTNVAGFSANNLVLITNPPGANVSPCIGLPRLS